MSNRISIYLVILCISYGLPQNSGDDNTATTENNGENFDVMYTCTLIYYILLTVSLYRT